MNKIQIISRGDLLDDKLFTNKTGLKIILIKISLDCAFGSVTCYRSMKGGAFSQ